MSDNLLPDMGRMTWYGGGAEELLDCELAERGGASSGVSRARVSRLLRGEPA